MKLRIISLSCSFSNFLLVLITCAMKLWNCYWENLPPLFTAFYCLVWSSILHFPSFHCIPIPTKPLFPFFVSVLSITVSVISTIYLLIIPFCTHYTNQFISNSSHIFICSSLSNYNAFFFPIFVQILIFLFLFCIFFKPTTIFSLSSLYYLTFSFYEVFFIIIILFNVYL